jgi:hypothetical protein
MSLTDARSQLLAALEAAEVPAYYGWGPFSTPCARIFPGEPWVAISGLAGGRRTQRWEVWAVAGRVDGGATFDELEALVSSINTTLETVPQFAWAEWRRPAITTMGGTQYYACRGSLETLMEV